jgi:hypothetical protein
MKMCYLALFGYMEHGDPMPPCDGRLVHVHLIPRRLLKREGADPNAYGSWVWGCGGPMGDSGHHGMLDRSRRLRIPRASLPPSTEKLAARHGLTWWLDREYGEKR